MPQRQFNIKRPATRRIATRGGNAELSFSSDFERKWNGQYSRAQKFLDAQVLKDCEPYTPMITGQLIKSGDLGTEIGSGTVQWIAPYARRVYYSTRKPGRETGPLRGGNWFGRAKAVYGQRWISGARKLAGGGAAGGSAAAQTGIERWIGDRINWMVDLFEGVWRSQEWLIKMQSGEGFNIRWWRWFR